MITTAANITSEQAPWLAMQAIQLTLRGALNNGSSASNSTEPATTVHLNYYGLMILPVIGMILLAAYCQTKKSQDKEKRAVIRVRLLSNEQRQAFGELPTILEDNLVFENKKDHLWHMDFDDVNSKLLISNKLQYIEPILTVSMIQNLRENFKGSLVLELYWEDKIDYDFVENNQNIKKHNLLNLFRKFISKKLRSIYN